MMLLISYDHYYFLTYNYFNMLLVLISLGDKELNKESLLKKKE